MIRSKKNKSNIAGIQIALNWLDGLLSIQPIHSPTSNNGIVKTVINAVSMGSKSFWRPIAVPINTYKNATIR